MPKIDEGQTHNRCSWLSSCVCCHCHYCHAEHLRERDVARAECYAYLAELDEQEKEIACISKTSSDRLKTILELQTELNIARECAREYLPDVKHSFDDMNRGRAYEREQRAKHSWLGPPEYPIEDIPD
jgi:hypothetical protein